MFIDDNTTREDIILYAWGWGKIPSDEERQLLLSTPYYAEQVRDMENKMSNKGTRT